ncbi:TetR/AcrR family transcriptional regulator [Intrasporangium sp.]|uniref:TetR/AcrR family transcriptional regulator n=1 Tax=Intrasporangium sp. TaxID=1925024 RepID=UPI00293ACE2E|nr:TetR/AcrR family transcriptional regulator C-terminal domain-containing protein [Intrasporangium sp.]MDV3220499.1 TetR/AcrR family transcriptional regulator [Intrasporangium sp.]
MTELPRYLQLLWGREPEGRRGPKPGRSIEEIGAAAGAIADRDGLGAVSMKSVAEAVGFTTMSLYRYVDSKDELHAVMLDVAYGRPELDYGDLDWRSRISLWTKEIAERRLAHPWTVELAQMSPPLTPHTLAWMEAGLEALAGTPLSSQQRLSAMLAIDVWSQNHVRQSTRMGLVGRPEPDSMQANYLAIMGELIDPLHFPHLAAAAPEAFDDADEDFFADEFDRGLTLLLDGIEALVARSR